MKLKVETEVSKELYELALGISAFVVVVKKAVGDGFKAGEDFGPILGSLMTDVVPALNGVDLISAEIAEDKSAAMEALILGLKPMLKSFATK